MAREILNDHPVPSATSEFFQQPNLENNMPAPHASWALCYDFIYEQTHGQLYRQLTDLTVQTIRELKLPPCTCVDFGAGTGRLAIPLARAGYAVTAVEPCKEMMQRLLDKAAADFLRVGGQVARMQDFQGDEQFDLALCVFTTVLYLLDEEALCHGLKRLAGSLRKYGRLLIDVPRRHTFQGYRRKTPNMDRRVTITQDWSDLYTYHEQTRCFMDGQWHSCEDRFSIRFWSAETILSILSAHDLECQGPVAGFQGTGADYYTGTKIG